MKPLLSIVIPTKNRYSTLFVLIDLICSFNDDRIELVVQDNSDDNSLMLKYEEKWNSYSNFKYYYSSKKFSVIQNSDLAVLNSNGEYVCFIGDDDGVMPFIADVAEWMKAENIDALKSAKPNYYWPDQKSNYLSNDTSGNLKIRQFNYETRKLRTNNGLIDTLKKGGTSMDLLPCLYHGIVKKDILLRIYDKCSSFFPGPSPDMANAIALTQYSDEFVFVDFPVIVSGKSAKSTGGQGVLHKHISRIEDVVHLPLHTAENWSTQVPKYWTGPTIWAESAIKGLENCGNWDEVYKMNFSYLYAKLLVFNWADKGKIFQDFDIGVFSIGFVVSYFEILLDRSFVFLKNRLSIDLVSYRSVNDIAEAVEILNNLISYESLPFRFRNKKN